MTDEEALRWLTTAVVHAQCNACDLRSRRVAEQLVRETQRALDYVRERLKGEPRAVPSAERWESAP